MADDLISRQAAIDFIDAGHLCNPNEPRWSDNEVVNFLKSRPSAQPDLARDIATIIENEKDMRVILKNAQRTGRWIIVTDSRGRHAECPYCGEWKYHSKQKFCGECGAKMEVEE